MLNEAAGKACDLRLHHIGHAVPEIDVAARLYMQRFGYALASEVIHDPAQTARVQFLHLAGDSCWFELVSPDGPGSRLTNAVRRGGGLNHLCFSAGPLEQAIAALEATGMKLISEPRPGVAFAGRRICWLLGQDPLPVELVERRTPEDRCIPGVL